MPAQERETLPGSSHGARDPAAGPPPTAERSSLRFVVQKHAARREHYDFRLEHAGVLLSWAVPKGPSLDPSEKHMAVHVEDHPVEYVDFEGVIPKPNYGAGEVIVWDKGRYRPLADFDEGLAKGKLVFEVFGYKLRGEFALVRLKKTEKDWLLIKHDDAWARRDAGLDDASVLSGLTIEELRDGPARLREAIRIVREAGAPERDLDARDVDLMLAQPRDAPFRDPDWLFEIKFDGYRLLAGRDGDDVCLRYRRGSNAAALYPEIALAVGRLPARRLVLDGEVVVEDPAGRPSFQRLQRRALLSRRGDIARASVETPAVLHAFDLLALEGLDLRALPLELRKRALALVVPARGPVRYVDHIETEGVRTYEAAVRLGLEGLVAKRRASAYRGGRSPDWAKLRIDHSGDFAVVGATAPKGSRVAAGALHLAWRDGQRWAYAGAVGTGLSDAQLAAARAELESHRESPREPRGRSHPADSPDLAGPVPRGRGHVFAEPTLVAEVRYHEATAEGLLRQPVFLRFRDDKAPEDCREAPSVRGHADAEPPPPAEPAGPAKSVKLTNPGKVFWPTEGYTKSDLLAYYRDVSPWLLPYLRDRPVMLVRYPDGIEGKSFYQKDAPEWTPEWVRTESLWSQDSGREISHFILDDLESLLYVVNMATVPLHVWGSRIAALERPDWCILDLDPKTAPFSDVIRVARATHELCEEIGLPSFLKTSGASGLHVLVPLAGLLTYEQCRQLGQLLAGAVVARAPGIATVERAVGARGGKVYVDFLQNGLGKTLAAPFSARPVPGARVSMPLGWKELTARLDPARFTIRTAVRRMERLGADPLSPVLGTTPDLAGALSRLHDLVGA